MRFAYTRRGGPLLDWSGPTPPYPSRAGETRSLGDFYATTRNSVALRRYGGTRDWPGGPKGYEHSRALGDLDLPMPGAPEVVEDYESPAPGASIVHLGHDCAMSGYMPEGAARGYGQTMLSADPPPPTKQLDMGLIRKAGILAAAYHGVKRNNGSILGGLLWAVSAWAVFPFYGTIVPAIAFAQGFAQPKAKSNPARKRRAKGAKRRGKKRSTAARKRAKKAMRARMRRVRAADWSESALKKVYRTRTIRGIGPYSLRTRR
jgi:hypothetical protein